MNDCRHRTAADIPVELNILVKAQRPSAIDWEEECNTETYNSTTQSIGAPPTN